MAVVETVGVRWEAEREVAAAQREVVTQVVVVRVRVEMGRVAAGEKARAKQVVAVAGEG